jgi:hypothetical protein
MKTNLLTAVASLACATAVVWIASPVFAEGPTRAQVQSDCASYMKTHEWSEVNGWQLKRGVKAPVRSVKSQAQIDAETIAFLKDNRWDETKSRFVSISGTPRDVSRMSRAQVAKEAAEFHRAYIWDEPSSGFISCKP